MKFFNYFLLIYFFSVINYSFSQKLIDLKINIKSENKGEQIIIKIKNISKDTLLASNCNCNKLFFENSIGNANRDYPLYYKFFKDNNLAGGEDFSYPFVKVPPKNNIIYDFSYSIKETSIFIIRIFDEKLKTGFLIPIKLYPNKYLKFENSIQYYEIKELIPIQSIWDKY